MTEEIERNGVNAKHVFFSILEKDFTFGRQPGYSQCEAFQKI